MAGWIPPRLRPLLGSDLDAVTIGSLTNLVGIAEDGDLDFKAEVHKPSEGDVKEAAYDVAQFANAAGGLLVLGVAEDGDGRATSVTGVDPVERDFGLWLHQLVASRISPTPQVVYRMLDAGEGRAVHLVSVAPSLLAPYAVSVGDGAVRYPLRTGNTRRYLTEPELADRYRRRFASLSDRDELVDELHLDARERWIADALPNEKPTTEWARLAVGLVPDLPGELELRASMPTTWREWLHPALLDFPTAMPREFESVGLDFRRLTIKDNEPAYVNGELHLDGTGLLAFVHLGGEGSRGIREGFCAIFDEHLVADLINATTALALHASRTGAVGNVTVSAQLRSHSRHMVVAQYRSQSPGLLRGSQNLYRATPVSRHTVPLEALVGSGPDRLVAARLLAADLLSAFGVAEPQQINANLDLVRPYFHRDVHRNVDEWAGRYGVQVVDTAG